MGLLGRARPTASVFVQLITLIGVTQLAANLMSLLVIFSLPPPAPDLYRLTEIEQALRGAPVNLGDRKALQRQFLDHPPVRPGHEPPGGRQALRVRARIALDLGLQPDDVVINVQRGPPPPERRALRMGRDRILREGPREEHFLVAPFQVGVRQADGRWAVVRPQPPFGLDPWQQRIALWFALSALAMAPVAYLIARRLAVPIRIFASAAERIGRDPQAPPLEFKGPSEIRAAVGAFNEMHQRLRRYVEDRTGMMAAIAHDLRTPLTRLRFRIEGLPADQRSKISADIDQMEAMISATLAFVRDATQPGERTPLELSSLLESLCDDLSDTGARAEVAVGEKVVIEGDPTALRRLFSNLLDNAVKFGGQARVRVMRDAASAIVEIDDNGPGIPAADTDRVFEPFYRREPSRSRETGGIGLGLAIVRSIARAHGGDVTLVNRPGGGLTVRVQLPL